MSLPAGPWYIDDVLTFYQTAHDPTTGGAVDADAVPTYRVYEVETGTAILTGSMALLDSGNTVGFYSESITLSAANGFNEGNSYVVYKEVVVGGVTDTTEDSFKVIATPGAIVVSDVWEALQADHLTAGTMGAAMAGLTAQIAVAIANILVLSTFNPATDTVDGLTYESVLEAILAATCNVGVPSGATQVWMKRDGTTPKVSVALGATPGERTGSVIS